MYGNAIKQLNCDNGDGTERNLRTGAGARATARMDVRKQLTELILKRTALVQKRADVPERYSGSPA